MRHDSTEEKMRLLWSYVERLCRPVAFYTNKASLFHSTPKTHRKQTDLSRDEREPLPPTEIGRALRELNITWIAAHSLQAKGRVERNFGTAQDRLVKLMRVAGVKTIEHANEYLVNDYLVCWERELTLESASADNAHRRLDKSYHLAASLSHVEMRQVRSDHSSRWDGKLYQIGRQAVTTGLRGADVRTEKRLDGSLAVRNGERYLLVKECAVADKPKSLARQKRRRHLGVGERGSDWNRNFDLKKAPKVWQAAQGSGHRRGEAG